MLKDCKIVPLKLGDCTAISAAFQRKKTVTRCSCCGQLYLQCIVSVKYLPSSDLVMSFLCVLSAQHSGCQ